MKRRWDSSNVFFESTDEADRTDFSVPSVSSVDSGFEERAFQDIQLLKGFPRSERDARQRIFGHIGRDAGFPGQQLINSAQKLSPQEKTKLEAELASVKVKLTYLDQQLALLRERQLAALPFHHPFSNQCINRSL